MKRMSEVFDLPLTCQDEGCGTVGSVYEGDSQLILQAQESIKTAGLDRRLVVAARNEKSQHAAHAINHVDDLADALDDLLTRCAYEGMVNADTAIAKAALDAYRGEK